MVALKLVNCKFVETGEQPGQDGICPAFVRRDFSARNDTVASSTNSSSRPFVTSLIVVRALS